VFASVAKFQSNRPWTDEDFQANERVLVPLLKAQPGYRGYFEVISGERESVSITLWESQSDAEGGLAAIRPQLMDLVGLALAGPPERTFGEVVYADPPQIS
jgi:hypothetical protein